MGTVIPAYTHLVRGPAACFSVDRQRLSIDVVREIYDALRALGTPCSSVTADDHWSFLHGRLEQKLSLRQDHCGASDASISRPMANFDIDGLAYTFDLFNPSNELDLAWSTPKEPNLECFVLHVDCLRDDGSVLRISSHLRKEKSYFLLIERFRRIVGARHVRSLDTGVFGWYVAHRQGWVRPHERLWDFGSPITDVDPALVDRIPAPYNSRIQMYPLEDGRALLLHGSGFGSQAGLPFADVFGLIPIEDATTPDGAKRRGLFAG